MVNGMFLAEVDEGIFTFFKIYTVISENFLPAKISNLSMAKICLLYTSDAADE